MHPIDASIPFPVSQVRPASARPSVAAAGPAEAPRAARTPERTDRLVGAVVPGGVDFASGLPVPTGPAIPMYRHPADRNAAAVAIHAGRMIDVEG